MWIFCCGMRRSGSTLQYNLTKEIVESLGMGEGLGYIEPQEFKALYDAYPNKDKIFVVKSHLFIPEYVQLYSRQESLAIYSYRDLRDVFVSILRKDQKPFYKLILSGFVPSLIEQDSQWTNVNGLLISKYEDMVLDIEKEINLVASHLGLHLSPVQIRQISENNSLESQKEKIRNYQWENGKKYAHILYDPKTLLHANHIQSGKVGEWNSVLNPLQIAMVELLSYSWLIKNGYIISQKWVRPPFTDFMALVGWATLRARNWRGIQ